MSLSLIIISVFKERLYTVLQLYMINFFILKAYY
jgi:hypothetical protein